MKDGNEEDPGINKNMGLGYLIYPMKSKSGKEKRPEKMWREENRETVQKEAKTKILYI